MSSENSMIKWDRPLLESLATASERTPRNLKNNILGLAKSLNIQLPETTVRKMARPGFRSVSIREETREMLEVVAEEEQMSVPDSIYILAKQYLDRKLLKKTN